eukprot:scaffold1807_cov140-Cylindrotheca_fusiformis.AAC.17
MLFQATSTIALLAASASALSPNAGIPAESKAGMKLLSRARALDQNDDITWMAGYSLKYMGCSSLLQIREDGGGGDEDGESNLYTMNLVKFGLCPSDESCNNCGKGKAQYVVNMMDFIDAYTEMKMNAQEQACENIRENCYCDDDANDDEACENQCYEDAGLSDCIEYEGDEEFNAQEYLECKEIEGNNNNGNGNNQQQYYVGPICSDGFDINLATFYDNGCSKKTESGIYESLYYGSSLPFEKESMVTNDCIACKYVDEDQNNNGGNNNDDGDVEITELCEQSYEDAAKCEFGLSGSKYYADESGCDYINNVLPKLAKAASSITGSKVSRAVGGGGGGGAATAFAILFALTTVIMAAYSFFLYRKIHRAKVNLASASGSMA